MVTKQTKKKLFLSFSEDECKRLISSPNETIAAVVYRPLPRSPAYNYYHYRLDAIAKLRYLYHNVPGDDQYILSGVFDEKKKKKKLLCVGVK